MPLELFLQIIEYSNLRKAMLLNSLLIKYIMLFDYYKLSCHSIHFLELLQEAGIIIYFHCYGNRLIEVNGSPKSYIQRMLLLVSSDT